MSALRAIAPDGLAPVTGPPGSFPAALPSVEAPAVRLRIPVMMRPSLCWLAIAWSLSMAAAGVGLGLWVGAGVQAGAAAACNLCLASAGAWYLRYPVGIYEPATNRYVSVWPFGLAWRPTPSARRGGVLMLRGSWIVDSTRRWRPVLDQRTIRDGEWAVIARGVRKSPGRQSLPASGPSRPGFITRTHRLIGIAVVAIGAAGVITLLGIESAAPTMSVDDTGAALAVVRDDAAGLARVMRGER